MTVVHAMLSNAAVAAVLSVLVLAAGVVCRAPAVRHAAWVLVLLKLVTPPLFGVGLAVLPVSWGEPAPPTPEDAVLVPFTGPGPGARPAVGPDRTEAPVEGSGTGARGLGLGTWAVGLWAGGAAVWFVWQGRRIVRFRRRVAAAEPAPPEVGTAATGLAAALGIARPPAVKVVTGTGSPMLWGWGRGAAVLFPRGLLARLAPDARDALLAHELAHFLRRDHWVRVLEFVATGLYWWHPAVWLARAGIEAAEEECCDAWVVGGLAASPRVYAGALLAAVDFEAERRRPRLPPGACAANRSARLLRRRLVGILHADRPRPLRGGAALWVAVGAVLLARPVLRAAAPEPGEPPSPAIVSEAPRRPNLAPTRSVPRTAEPPAWATATGPGGGPTVLARDSELVLRLPDGTTRVLGPGRPLALAFAPDGRRLATAGPGPLVRTWDDRGEPVAKGCGPAAARALAYTPDGTRLLVLDAAGGVTVRDPQTLTPVAGWSVGGPANSIACAPDGRTVAISFGSWLAETGWVECWSIAERRKLVSYSAPAPVGAVRFAPDGGTLVVGGWNGHVVWRTLPSGTVLADRRLPKNLVAAAAFSPDAGTLPLHPPPEPEPEPEVPEWVPRPGPVPER